MDLQSDSDKNPQAKAGDNESGNERHQPAGELPSIVKSLQSPPSPSANPPPDEKPSKWRENTKLGLEIFGLAVLCAYTVFSCLQWLQIRWTNRLTREALDGSGSALTQTLDKMQGQITQMSRLADNAKTQADRTKDLADRALTQIDVMRQGQRAWMGLSAEIAGHLTFKNNLLIASVPIKLTATNAGHSPALSVKSQIGLIPIYGTPTKQQVDTFCGVLEKTKEVPEVTGEIFVSGESRFGVALAISNYVAMEKAIKLGETPGWTGIGLITCIDYRTVLDNKDHYTRRAYQMQWIDTAHGGVVMGSFFPRDEEFVVQMAESPVSSAD